MTKTLWADSEKRIFFVLWILCIMGAWSVLPYVQQIGVVPSSLSFFKLFLIATLQAVLVFGVICWLSYLLVVRTDLSPFMVKNPLKRIVYPGLIAGIVVGLAIRFLDRVVFQDSSLSEMHATPWVALLGAVYGGVNEEVVMRLFLFTLIYFLLNKFFKSKVRHRLSYLWVTNLVVAIVFGIAHLPAAFKLVMPSGFEVFRVLLLNGIPSVALGWLYWSRGFFAAMVAHFVLDIVVHVLRL
jgi:hypothetical protein